MYRSADKRLLRSALKTACLILLLCISFFHNAIAQENACDPEASLILANDEFNAGHFSSVAEILEPCIKQKKFTREQLVRAHQLLAQTYLILENSVAAEESYLNLLKANPEYISDPSRDPIDIVYLSKKFTATPIFSWFATLGGNITLPGIIASNKTFEGSNTSIKVIPSWSFGGGLIWNANERLSADIGLSLFSSSFSFQESSIFTYDELEVRESQFSLYTPISVKYTFVRKGLSPYVYAGVSANLLLYANQNFSLINKTPITRANETVEFEQGITEFGQQVNFKRSLTNQSLHLGAGFRWKFKLDYLFVDLRYSQGLNNVVNGNTFIQDGNSRTSSRPAFAVGYVDDFFRMNQMQISVGYIKPLYKPRKLKRARTKGVLRDIKRDNDETSD